MEKLNLKTEIPNLIYIIRGHKVMLDRDLAKLYQVTTFNLNKAVKRNIDRFPKDFLFRLRKEEYDALRFQFGMLKRGQHSKYLSYAFTQEGVSMLSSVLKSKRAIKVNIEIMRVFVRLRNLITNKKELAKRIDQLEGAIFVHDSQIQSIFKAIRGLMDPPVKKGKKIGFGS